MSALRTIRRTGRLAVTVAIIAAAMAAAVPSAAAGTPSWTIQPTPNPGGTSATLMNSVSCPSATECLAVGYIMRSGHNFNAFTEFWNGVDWITALAYQPAGATVSDLMGVSCPSTTTCVAVGYYHTSGGTFPLAERWTGAGWMPWSPVVPAGATNTMLTGVSCPSLTTCVAVGYTVNPTTNSEQDLAELSDGEIWTIQATQPALSGVDFFLNAVSCSSATDCLAVGQYHTTLAGADQYLTWSEHWNGSIWTGWYPGAIGGYYNNLAGVSCPSATACTAVGWAHAAGGNDVPVAERWTGAGWVTLSPKFPVALDGTVLTGVSCASVTSCTAVGWAYQSLAPAYAEVPVAESWGGTGWTLGSPLSPSGATQSTLATVSCTSATVCTAVGWWNAWTPSTTGFFQISSLAERYS
jgi:hypothetical protein